jgi:cytochrome bd ubiquinol oxidase subunit II
MSPLILLWYVMGLGLIAWVLTGGADFGGGVWHLLARGPTAAAQRAAIERAIAPIWEANHVWLIFLIVVLFTVFPAAFAVISVALHLPVTGALIGIVLRGSAFVFRAYGLGDDARRRRWGRVFAAASVVAPFFLGLTLAGVSSGAIVVTPDGAGGEVVQSGFFAGWTTPFALGVGAFATALFALLAALYLCADGPAELREGNRRGAAAAELVAGALALFVSWRAAVDAPLLWQRFAAAPHFWPVQVGTAVVAGSVLAALWARRFAWARALGMGQVVLVVVAWGLAMEGELVLGAVHLMGSGTRPETLAAVLPALAVGFALCLPALFYLLRLFRTAP